MLDMVTYIYRNERERERHILDDIYIYYKGLDIYSYIYIYIYILLLHKYYVNIYKDGCWCINSSGKSKTFR